MKSFYLGTQEPGWLKYRGPWFININRLSRFGRVISKDKWALDSGAFTELSGYGRWTRSLKTYIENVIHLQEHVGSLEWCSPQDWMCEPFIVAKTGLSVKEHQLKTLVSFVELRSILGKVVIPVIQGWSLHDYEDHLELYYKYGIYLEMERLVGVGSICRRQGTAQVTDILSMIANNGINIHAFGLKLTGLRTCAKIITSSDSQAWSIHARFKSIQLPGHTHKSCGSCREYANLWRTKVNEYVDK